MGIVAGCNLIMALSMLKTTLSRLFKTEVTEVEETPQLYLRLTTNCMAQVNRMTKIPTSPKFNHEQCGYLAYKLSMAVQSAHIFVEQVDSTFASDEDKARSLEIFKLLFALGKEVECFIQDCCKDAWIQSAILLTNVSEHISSLGFDLEFCTVVFSNRKKFESLPTLTVAEVARTRKVEAEIVEKKSHIDKMRLKRDLSALIQSSKSCSAEWQLATFLHEKINSARMHMGVDLPRLNQANRPEISMSTLKQTEKLGEGGFATVHKANWLGTEVARKTFHGPRAPCFEQEVKILEGLCHPNIVSLLWYTRDERKCYIVMELMDGDLFSLIQERLEECGTGGPPFSILEAVHMMLQVAEGMLFLHEKQIVHRDLKSRNILVKLMKAGEVGVKHVHVKVADFGLSRTKERSMTHTLQTPNQGTTRWMAPEMINLANDSGQAHMHEAEGKLKYPFKVDVYSFGMVCFEILTGDIAFPTLSAHEVKMKVLAGERPQLPDRCPGRLRYLIEACWSSEPSTRPRFGDICAELRHLKCALLMNSARAKAPRCFNLDEIMIMTNKFSEDNILSRGALSMEVYKGVRSDTGEVVAVKRVFEKYFRDLDEFSTQMKLLSGLHHNNLVGYVGFCYAKDETILVFEYMPNDSLDQWLSDDLRKANMTWPVRRNICLGVANGIRYLRSLSQTRIVHPDIKASNIVLDQTLEPRITGFQFALLISKRESEIRPSQQCVGTLGSSEYFDKTGQVSEKVAVYNFGVLLIEIVSGRRNIDLKLPEEQDNLGEWALRLYSEGRIDELIDPALALDLLNKRFEAVGILMIALLCIDTALETRPDIALVVTMLQEKLNAGILRLGFEHDKEHLGILVEMSKAKNQSSRQEAASKLRMLVTGKRCLTELEEAGGIAALVALLGDLDLNCRRDALIALQALPPSIAIPVDRLPLEIVLDFYSQKWPIDVRNAAAGLLYKRKGALEAALNSLDKIPDVPSGQRETDMLFQERRIRNTQCDNN